MTTACSRRENNGTARPTAADLLALSLILVFQAVQTLGAEKSLPGGATSATATAATDDIWYHAGFWTSLDGKPVEESWAFSDREVRLVQPRGGRGSIISPPLPEFFELSFDWMIGPKANNGLKYRVRQFGSKWLGIEYQMIDERIPLQQVSNVSTASMYGLVAPALDKPLNPATEWNQARILAHGDRIEHWLNGVRVAEAKTSGPAWAATVARSKFPKQQGFGESRHGDRIMLTDHGGKAAYRNFRLNVLPPPVPDDGPAE